MTGHGSAVGAMDATAFGAYDYILKPFSVDEVLVPARSIHLRSQRGARSFVAVNCYALYKTVRFVVWARIK